MSYRLGLFIAFSLVLSACFGPRAPNLICSTDADRPPTGDLAVDMVGSWRGVTSDANIDRHHPIARFAPGEGGGAGSRTWMFRSDGTGHLWWVWGDESGDIWSDGEFVWEVVDGMLVVDELPPATIDIRDHKHLVLPVEDGIDPDRGVSVRRCNLEVPDGIRGLDE